MAQADETAKRSIVAAAAPGQSKSSRFRRLGAVSWAALGMIFLLLVIAGGVSALSGILVPLIIAVILGTVLEPVVTWLVARKVPRGLAAAIVLLAASALAIGIAILVIRGFVQQLPEIAMQMLRGWTHILEWLRSLDLDPTWIEQLRQTSNEYIELLSRGAVGMVTGAVFGAVSFSLGTFFALYFLFFVLRDSRVFPNWFARVAGLEAGLVTEIDVQVRQSMRGYFSGTALTAVITGPIFVIPLLLLGIPLVIPMIILYFVLSFVPFVGAWITGAFAILIAFGYGGSSAALIVTLSLLVSNGPVQNIVLSWALGTSLSLHPVTVLLSTIIGGVVAGALGMVLGPPLMSALQKGIATVRSYRARESSPPTVPALS